MALNLLGVTNSPLWMNNIVRQHDNEGTPVDHGIIPVIHRYPRIPALVRFEYSPSRGPEVGHATLGT